MPFFVFRALFITTSHTCFLQCKPWCRFCLLLLRSRSICEGFPPNSSLHYLKLTWQIKHDQGHVRVLQIARYQTLESLLPCCIPQLQSYYLTRHCDIFGYEINADCWLNKATITFLVGSNSFLMYLEIIELFPTFWSPTSTTLNFWIVFRLLEKLIWSFMLFTNIIKIQKV